MFTLEQQDMILEKTKLIISQNTKTKVFTIIILQKAIRLLYRGNLVHTVLKEVHFIKILRQVAIMLNSQIIVQLRFNKKKVTKQLEMNKYYIFSLIKIIIVRVLLESTFQLIQSLEIKEKR
jgi:hypothetical protein